MKATPNLTSDLLFVVITFELGLLSSVPSGKNLNYELIISFGGIRLFKLCLKFLCY